MTPNSVSQDQALHNDLPSYEQRQAPAYPLVTHDPYFSIWSCGDKINESTTRHWSGKSHELSGLIRVDGRNYIFLGSLPAGIDPGEVLQAQQTQVQITATHTIYYLVCGGVEVVLSFISPLLMNDLDLLSRPVTYISIKTISLDQKDHEVQVYFGASANIATNEPEQVVTAEGFSTSTLNIL